MSNENISLISGLALTSGILIIVSGLISLLWTQNLGFGFMYGMMGSMMGWGSMMGGWMFNMLMINILSGSIIILSAIMMNLQKNTKTFGILILIFASLSLISFGGFLIGAILGIIAGALALSKA